ncbi:MAG: ABC transporter ATPase [Flavobacteriales bacterium]|jgi:hypothetical protein|nr:ABC transporter ATPase [Flavobacteriales bacterium]MBT5931770.1 ABC transporter ATPase [Flavobacteriales bacterium]MDC0272421.1 ABC transporter ATPase [Crocinitomicaceae bacterium]MDC0459546.1 ABC transporter ATPase [Crocinitomicaceae bacterium]MDO7614686.1 ABC transporter ATPase [Crocinitomicaceae bacterium]
MQQNYKDLFKTLPEHSRVWIYLSDRLFTQEESEIILTEVDAFVSSWKAHQKSLNASGTLILNRFLILAVDENTEAASGCSIDSSVNFVKSIGLRFGVDFFNRLNMLILKDGKPTMISFHDLASHKEENIFNPNIDSLRDLRQNWIIPVKESPFI